MKISSRVTTMFLLAFLVPLLAVTSWAQTRPPIVQEMAKAYGIDSWSQIDAIRYTFNLQIPAFNLSLSHSWVWEPKTNQVSYEGKDKEGKPVKVSYQVSQLNSQPAAVKDEINPAFVNDQYWLIFPFHVVWDTSASVEDKGMQKLPVGTGSAQLVTVKYPSEAGGFTPGDTWDLYIGKDKRVEYFVYHRGGDKKPSVVSATWAGYKKAGPLLVSTDHRGTADGKPLHLTFTNVAVKVAGSDKWVEAK
jgi:hypothetical protein